MIKNIFHRKKKDQVPARITNDTVTQYREKILAGGRKHKYPLQYTKKKLVINTIIISAVCLVAITILVWARLYVWHDTGDVAYRITRIIPLPVASIDGESVRYSDYLLYQRSTLAANDKLGQTGTDDKASFQRKQAMDLALKATYAKKIARERSLTVDEKDLNARIDEQRKNSKLSDSAYESVVQNTLHLSSDEVKYAMRAELLRQMVSFEIDETAATLAQTVDKSVKGGDTLENISKQQGNKVQFVPETVIQKDGADETLTADGAKLEIGKVSGPLKLPAGDGYYFIAIRSRTSDTITYSYLRVPLTEFKKQFEELEKNNKIHYYISL